MRAAIAVTFTAVGFAGILASALAPGTARPDARQEACKRAMNDRIQVC